MSGTKEPKNSRDGGDPGYGPVLWLAIGRVPPFDQLRSIEPAERDWESTGQAVYVEQVSLPLIPSVAPNGLSLQRHGLVKRLSSINTGEYERANLAG